MSRAFPSSNWLETYATRSVLANPHNLHLRRRQAIDELELRARVAISNQVDTGRERISSMARALEALSPLQVLTRGYSLTTKLGENKPLQSAEDLSSGDFIRTRLNDGEIISRVAEADEA